MSLPVPQSLIKDGFQQAVVSAEPRLLLATDGFDKTGKTEFALSAPGPIVVFNLDMGLEGVVEKWLDKKVVVVEQFEIPTFDKQQEYAKLWSRFYDKFRKAVANQDVRTIFCDTGDDVWALERLAEFGTLNPRMTQNERTGKYGVLNELYKSLIRMVYFESGKNLILTHKLKKRYVKYKNVKGEENEAWDGTWERGGFKEQNYLIQANLRHRFTQGEGFAIDIINCRQNMDLAGYTLTGSECNFTGLAATIFPNVDPGYWEG